MLRHPWRGPVKKEKGEGGEKNERLGVWGGLWWGWGIEDGEGGF